MVPRNEVQTTRPAAPAGYMMQGEDVVGRRARNINEGGLLPNVSTGRKQATYAKIRGKFTYNSAGTEKGSL